MKTNLCKKLLLAAAVLSTASLVAEAQTNYIPYTFTTLAGSGTGGFSDGTGTNASFFNTEAMAVDGAGNLYVGDSYRNRVVSPAGLVTTLVGVPFVTGCGGGTNSLATVGQAVGMAVEISGTETNVYFPDSSCGTIRKMSRIGADWVVTTIAGTYPNGGYLDGINGTARFSQVARMARDNAGNLYVADIQNSAIRKITPVGLDWVVTTLAGGPGNFGNADGTNGDAQFITPVGVAVDSAGHVFVLERNNFRIREIVQRGSDVIVTTIAGQAGNYGFADGIGTNAQFNYPEQIAADSNGHLFVTDSGNRVVRRLELVGTNWVVSTIAGLPFYPGNADGTGGDARFFLPDAITVGGDGTVYVSDLYYQTIRKGVIAVPLQILGSTVRFTGGQLAFDLTGPSGQSVVVEASDNLQSWSPVWTNVLGVAPISFSDTSGGNVSQRFYRAVISP